MVDIRYLMINHSDNHLRVQELLSQISTIVFEDPLKTIRTGTHTSRIGIVNSPEIRNEDVCWKISDSDLNTLNRHTQVEFTKGIY